MLVDIWNSLRSVVEAGSFEKSMSVLGISKAALYHSNFGPPLMEKDAKFAAPVREVSPFNDYAGKLLSTWQTYQDRTKDFDEVVYNVFPYGDENGVVGGGVHLKPEEVNKLVEERGDEVVFFDGRNAFEASTFVAAIRSDDI